MASGSLSEHQQKSNQLNRQYLVRIGQINDELDELSEQIQAIPKVAQNRPRLATLLNKKKELLNEKAKLEGKHQNMNRAGLKVQNAQESLESAHVLKEGAAHLEAVAEQLDAMDMDEVIEKYETADDKIGAFEEKLITPMLNDVGTGRVYGEALDYDPEDELDAMMTDNLEMPSVPIKNPRVQEGPKTATKIKK